MKNYDFFMGQKQFQFLTEREIFCHYNCMDEGFSMCIICHIQTAIKIEGGGGVAAQKG